MEKNNENLKLPARRYYEDSSHLKHNDLSGYALVILLCPDRADNHA